MVSVIVFHIELHIPPSFFSRGLEQSVALPRDSYLQPYYRDISTLLRVGPPLMLVVEGMQVAGNDSDVNRVCSIAGCDDDSMLNMVRHCTVWNGYIVPIRL